MGLASAGGVGEFHLSLTVSRPEYLGMLKKSFLKHCRAQVRPTVCRDPAVAHHSSTLDCVVARLCSAWRSFFSRYRGNFAKLPEFRGPQCAWPNREVEDWTFRGRTMAGVLVTVFDSAGSGGGVQ